ncbi:aspartate ammonia-lyase [Marinifilum sp. D714]|uniref:aspartate ammonia-lyase n=1 Tax=Marinifilum sp. D714 TaxID=2937523 RepID=UPI0027D0A06A|nr:aspartate ammonia-lyase [Marinifilum sp. D714]MDQ2177653.1 aspartate ammonia-lyase [Marinifilum sp. D714]
MKTRTEHDLIGYKEVPADAYYGIQTLRAVENFDICGVKLSAYPNFIKGLAMVKWAAAKANNDLNLLTDDVTEAITKACEELIDGKHHDHFPVDMIQGGAGTSTNMNANEVIANRALEILGYQKGEYEHCHPNNHINLSQSTNDAYPTAIKIALMYMNENLVAGLKSLITAFRAKGEEFKDVLKMGRTQLQDAVPMTLGQEFEAWAVNLEEEIERLNQNAKLFLEVNMGATAIGTGINSEPGYSEKCVAHLNEITKLPIVLAGNLIEATPDTGSYVMYSSAVKRLAVKLSKICNDLRLLSSGPRCGLNEINLPKMQPGSSIMPGKVNPVIPEVVNQVAYKVIGNDLTVTFAAEAGQLELNVMEPVLVRAIFESMEMLENGMATLKERCIEGITANVEHCKEMVLNSIGIVTAVNPTLGYEASSRIAKRALAENRSVYDLILEEGLLTKEKLDEILSPERMIKPQKFVEA